MKKIIAKTPTIFQQIMYCPYCKTRLLYLYHDDKLIGLGLDNWLFCNRCKRKYKIGIKGLEEKELNIEVSL